MSAWGAGGWSVAAAGPDASGGPGDATQPVWVGYLAVAVAVLCYGTQNIPIKRFDAGDGVVFQWVQLAGIALTGAAWHTICGSPALQPAAMIGGAMWALGNLCSVPVIQCIGLGMGVLLWGLCNMGTGWAIGRFGIPGLIDKQAIGSETYNNIGIVLIILSSVLYVFIEPVSKPVGGPLDNDAHTQQTFLDTHLDAPGIDCLSDEEYIDGEKDALLRARIHREQLVQRGPHEPRWVARLGPVKRRVVGVLLSIFSGILYGASFAPSQTTIDHGGEPDINHYVFSQFLGTFFFQTAVLIVYCLIKNNKPVINNELVLPGLIGGVLWGVATTAFNNGNSILSFSVSFPLISAGPGLVSSLWGILLFGEIQGSRNRIFFAGGTVLLVAGAVFIGLSH